ncbi:MAG: DUF362 domain-containing protein [Phycisphaerae bacterium]|nr:DUF362 domain-containing protein [Phycisphaerae bacterium]
MTRREFLALLGLTAGSSPAIAASQIARPKAAPATSTAPTSARSPRPKVASQAKKALVAEIRSPKVVVGPLVHERRLREMIGLALQYVTGQNSEADAWHAILEPNDVIGLKFNGSGARGLASTAPFAQSLVASLTAAGWAPEKIILIEVDPYLVAKLQTQSAEGGWQSEKTNFGSGRDQLAAWLDKVTAIVNVPFLKVNPIAGMSGCLKNLSHALVRHPAFFHANAAPDPKRGVLEPGAMCAPYVGDIVGCPPVRDKLRLHLVNALRVCREAMYEPSGTAVEPYGAVLAGRDPVAIDMMGLEILNELRRSHDTKPLAGRDEPLPQLVSAERAGVGTWQPDFIEHLAARV